MMMSTLPTNEGRSGIVVLLSSSRESDYNLNTANRTILLVSLITERK
jgi:hypothetical protein